MASSSIALLLIALSALSALADVSIDCGSSTITVDSNFIGWVGDDLYTQSGKPMSVPSSSSVSTVMDTLRAFPTGKKNCYSVPSLLEDQVLVRASFYYGNYDKKSAPPTFDLLLDGDLWDTVVTSSTRVVRREAIYVVKAGGTTSVCVASRSPNVVPFMSALEIRSLSSTMYKYFSSDGALFLSQRSYFGDTTGLLLDSYGRMWNSLDISSDFILATSDATVIDGTTAGDDPPQDVLQHALTVSTTSNQISLTLTNLPTTNVPIYINMYFSEVTELDSTQQRSIDISINGESISSDEPIVPTYGSAYEYTIYNVTANSNTSFSLAASTGSTLPPLINAFEIFVATDALVGTNSDDVDGLSELQSVFSVLQQWGGDPCLPAAYSWEWVDCSSDATPRITGLHLGGFGLSGILPDFSTMDALETVDFHNNSIEGPIPDFLGSLSSLKELNLADNDFSGLIPITISDNKKLKLETSGNSNLCTSSSKSCKTTTTTGSSSPSGTTSNTINKKKKSKLPVILGTAIPLFAAFWVILGVCVRLQQKRKSAAIAAISAGQNGRPYGPNGTPAQGQGKEFVVQMAGKTGASVMNEAHHSSTTNNNENNTGHTNDNDE